MGFNSEMTNELDSLTPIKRLNIKNAGNIRNIGGYETNEGKVTAWNRLYRADGLADLTLEEWQILVDRGIKTDVDLRSGAEVQDRPDIIPEGMRYMHCPLQREQIDSNNLAESAAKAFSNSMTEGYCNMVRTHVDLLINALREVVNGLDNGAVVYHCTAGKDRTGVLSSVILKLLGVSNVDIIADYQVSYTYNTRLIEQLVQAQVDIEQLRPMLLSEPESMENLLRYLDEIDLEEYLYKNGLEKAVVEKIRAIMLV